jgi:hypothetical protein
VRGERSCRTAEAVGVAEDLGRVDADQPNLADPAEPKRVAVGVAGDGRGVGGVRGGLEGVRVRAASNSDGCS